MRKPSTLFTLAAAAVVILVGALAANPFHFGPTKAHATQGGFSPNALLVNVDLKTEAWDCF